MKRMFLGVLLMTVISITSFSRECVACGNTHSTFGDYKIETADKPVTINGEAFTAYLISYQNSPLEVKVVLREEKKHKTYVVLSEKLSLQYVYNEKFLGVEKLDNNLKVDHYLITDAALNKNEYFHQKVLASGKRSDLENIQFIAAYFPMLLKETGETLTTM